MNLNQLALHTVLYIFLIIYSNAKSVSREDPLDYCYAKDDQPYVYLGTRTPYCFVQGEIKNITLPNCTPVQVWAFFRHGTRFPSLREIKNLKAILPGLRDEILRNQEDGRVHLCEPDLENLKHWKINENLTETRPKFLSEQGKRDLEEIGKRLRHKFFHTLFSNLSESTVHDYEFRTSDTQRTIESMRSFIKGLFGNESIPHPVRAPMIDHKLLKGYDNCKLWTKLLNDSAANVEVDAFRTGPTYQKLIRQVSQRLGFRKNLTSEIIETIYDGCTFEKAWHIDKTSPWCGAFTKDHMRIEEYSRDLFSYYHMGYGFNISRQLGCPILQNMFNHFLKLEKAEANQPRGVFLFSHSVAINFLFTSMGLFEDSVPLTASNYKSMTDRKWRRSFTTPYATNLLAVFYKCNGSNKVRFFMAEKAIMLKDCDADVCDWDYLKKKMGALTRNCGLQEVCNT